MVSVEVVLLPLRELLSDIFLPGAVSGRRQPADESPQEEVFSAENFCCFDVFETVRNRESGQVELNDPHPLTTGGKLFAVTWKPSGGLTGGQLVTSN